MAKKTKTTATAKTEKTTKPVRDTAKLSEARAQIAHGLDLLRDANAPESLRSTIDRSVERIDKLVNADSKKTEKVTTRMKTKLEKLLAEAKAAGINVGQILIEQG